jgi:GNAT superfamily N-acetyltransferase
MQKRIAYFDRLDPDMEQEFFTFRHEQFFNTDGNKSKEKIEQTYIDQDEKYFSEPAGYLFWLDEHDEIIASILLFKRTVAFRDSEIFLGGLGTVCTHRDYRGKGLGTQLLYSAMKYLKDWQCEVALLCTEIKDNGKFYSAAGFVPLKDGYDYTGKSGEKYHEDEGMLAYVLSKDKFDQLLKSKEKLDIGFGNW